MATYPPPNQQSGSIFNPSDWIAGNNTNLDIAYLNEHYCKFPVAQGNMSFAGINNTGTTIIKQNIVMTGTYNLNYLEFPDGTKQYSASASNDILNTANTFTQNNTFPSISLNTETDDNYSIYSNTTAIDYGLVIANTNGLGTLTLSNNSSTLTTMTSTTNGLSIDDNIISTGSITGQSLNISNCNIFSSGFNTAISNSSLNSDNPIIYFALYDTSNNQIIPLSISYNSVVSSVDLNMNNNDITNTKSLGFSDGTIQTTAYTGVVDGYASLAGNNNFTNMNNFNCNSNGQAITTQGLTITRNMEVGYNDLDLVSINSTTTTGLNIYCESTSVSSASIPKIQVYNDGTATLFNTNVTLPPQTAYSSSTTYGDLASTQAFVQSAIQSQGGGDVSLAGNNTFTGVNTFSTAETSTVQTFPQVSSNQFASLAYVNNLQSTTTTLLFNVGIGTVGTSQYFNIPSLIILNIVQINYTINVANVSETSSDIISFTIMNENFTGPENLKVSVYIASTNQIYNCPITYWVFSGGNTIAQAGCPIYLYGLGNIVVTYSGYLTIA